MTTPPDSNPWKLALWGSYQRLHNGNWCSVETYLSKCIEVVPGGCRVHYNPASKETTLFAALTVFVYFLNVNCPGGEARKENREGVDYIAKEKTLFDLLFQSGPNFITAPPRPCSGHTPHSKSNFEVLLYQEINPKATD